MKNICFFIAFLCALAIQAKPVTITGKINGKLPEFVYYSAPVNGNSGFDIAYSTKPAANGDFEFKCDFEGVAFIDVYYEFKFAGTIIAEPGNTYNIAITEEKGKVTGVISSKNTEVQKAYYDIMPGQRMAMVMDLSRAMSGIQSPAELDRQLNEKMDKDIAAFTAMYKKKAISAAVYEAIRQERRFFYIVSLAYNVLMRKNIAIKKGETVEIEPLFRLWKERQQFDKANLTEIEHNPFGFYYLETYRIFKKYEDNNFKEPKQEPYDAIAQFNHLLGLFGKDKNEYYQAVYLSNELSAGSKEESLLLVYDEFKIGYPNSPYLAFITPKTAPLITFSNQDTAPVQATIIAGYEKINSFKELVSKFAGKKLYIDVWATSCGPCRAEFKHNEQLYAILKQQGYTILYISTDEEVKDSAWKKMVNYYKLEGHHVRVNEMFHNDLRVVYNDNGSIGIPWHILVGVDGSIKRLHAAGGTDPEELKKQLEAL